MERGQPRTGWRLTPWLLACGVAAPLTYLASDVLAGTRWEGYSFRDQTISELNANGSPVRSTTIVLGLLGYAFLGAFGVGTWRAAGGDRRLRAAGGLLIALAAFSLWGVPFASMNLRGTEQGAAGARHLFSGMVAIPLLVATMALAALAMGRAFRLYTVATAGVLLVFGGWSGSRIGAIEDGLATPWVGVIERISVYAYQAWLAVFALVLLRWNDAREDR